MTLYIVHQQFKQIKNSLILNKNANLLELICIFKLSSHKSIKCIKRTAHLAHMNALMQNNVSVHIAYKIGLKTSQTK